jgi:hypothetical protein
MADMISPWIAVDPLDRPQFAELRRRAIFECCKWDPQVGDSCVIASVPLVMTHRAWREVSILAEALAQEAQHAEQELALRPDLHHRLGLPHGVRRALGRIATDGRPDETGRLLRFDFHFTTDGWRISEANSDVPGGLNEASGLAPILQAHYPGTQSVGDPAGAYAAAIANRASDGQAVALVHATAFSDDLQMMRYIASRLSDRGIRSHPASPTHLRWSNGRASLRNGPQDDALAVVVRFFPAEWLAELPSSSSWERFFAGSRTLLSNPATAILTQTKRFPLVWDALRTPLPTWRACLPESRDPRDAPWRSSSEWILKPAFGRVGEGIRMSGVVPPPEMRKAARAATLWPRAWVAQRRFEMQSLATRDGALFPCLGVYTLDGRVIGAYGRLAAGPLVDARAADAAVLAA